MITGWTVDIHLFFVALMALIPLHNLYVLFTVKEFPRLAYRVRFPAPMYHLFNSCVIFTGIILMIITGHWFSVDLLLMVAASGTILGMEIKRFKMVKDVRRNQYDLHGPFIAFAKKKYMLDLVILGAVTLIAWK